VQISQPVTHGLAAGVVAQVLLVALALQELAVLGARARLLQFLAHQ
jgi:hypothetical protein